MTKSEQTIQKTGNEVDLVRSYLRDIGRVIGLPYGHVDKICKMIPFDPSRPLTLQESIDREPRFKQEIKNTKALENAHDIYCNLDGAS